MLNADVAILLCSYNGGRYLSEQLDSLAKQTHHDWKVWASDDGSTDNTCTILRTYARKKWPSGWLVTLQGPAEGATANFLSLVCNPSIEADYYAYADQDDVWDADKLERALYWLANIPAERPALYCARTRYVDEDNREIGLSPLFSKPAGFANALVQNVAGGNTMVFNHSARELLREAGADVPAMIHDWWTYLVVSGCGGVVHYDRHPSVRYRQHHDNLIGMNTNWSGRATRIRLLWQGRFRSWTDDNIAAIRVLQHRLTPKNQELFGCFAEARRAALVPRLLAFKRSGIYRQTLLGNLGLAAAAVLGKI